MRGDSGETVLVTGGTGLLGAAVIARILRAQPPVRLVALVREPARWGAIAASLGTACGRVRAVRGDVCLPGLGLAADVRAELERQASSVVHLAADTSFSRPLAQARAVNVAGTRNVLELAADWRRDVRLLHVSTAFVAGRRTGIIRERDDANARNAGWVNAYEQSKLEAEQLVRASGLLWTIARSSTIVCDSTAGGVTQVNAVHRALQLLHRGLAPMLPSDPGSLVDLVPADFVADAIVTLRSEPSCVGHIYHLCAGAGAIPLAELLEASFALWSVDAAWRRRGIARPVLTDLATYALFERAVEDVGAPSLRRITRSLSYFVPQLALPKRFDTSEADAVLGHSAPPVRAYLLAVLRTLTARVAASTLAGSAA